ncbi:MAG: tyrosine-type recombinase/integrase, partial [Rhodospirillales bacterium]
NGLPYAANSLSKIIAAACRRMELDGVTLHGLRKLHLTWIADAGGSEHTLQASGGHRSTTELRRYTMRANQRKLAQAGIATLPDMPRTGSGKPTTEVANPASAGKK